MSGVKESELYKLVEKYLPDELNSWYEKYMELDTKGFAKTTPFEEQKKLWDLKEKHQENMRAKVYQALIAKDFDGWLQSYIALVGGVLLGKRDIPWNRLLGIDTYQAPEEVNTPVVRWWSREILLTLKQARTSYGKSALIRLLRGVGKQKKDKGAGVLSTDRGWSEEMVETFIHNFSSISGPLMERHSIGIYTSEYKEALEKLGCGDEDCERCDVCEAAEKEREKLVGNRFALQAGTTDQKMFDLLIEKIEAMGVEPPEQIGGYKKETKAYVPVPFKVGDKLKKSRVKDIPFSLPIGRTYSVAELRQLCIHLELTPEYKAGCEQFLELYQKNSCYAWDSMVYPQNTEYEKMLKSDTAVMYRTSYKGKSTGYTLAYLKGSKIILEQHFNMGEAPVYDLYLRWAEPKEPPILKGVCKFQVKKIPN